MLQPQILSLIPSSNTSLADGTNTLDPFDVFGVEDPSGRSISYPGFILPLAGQRWQQRIIESEWLAWPVKDCINTCKKLLALKAIGFLGLYVFAQDSRIQIF